MVHTQKAGMVKAKSENLHGQGKCHCFDRLGIWLHNCGQPKFSLPKKLLTISLSGKGLFPPVNSSHSIINMFTTIRHYASKICFTFRRNHSTNPQQSIFLDLNLFTKRNFVILQQLQELLCNYCTQKILILIVQL